MQLEEQQSTQPVESAASVPQLTLEDIRKVVAEEAPKAMQKQVNEHKAQQLLESFVSKVDAHPDVAEMLQDWDFQLPATVDLIREANKFDNTVEIMREIGGNPMKQATMTVLAATQPKQFAKAMQDLSKSIKQNEEAVRDTSHARAPFDQIKPSQKASVDSGSMSVSDWRRKHMSGK